MMTASGQWVMSAAMSVGMSMATFTLFEAMMEAVSLECTW